MSKISLLSPADFVSGEEFLPAVQGGQTKRIRLHGRVDPETVFPLGLISGFTWVTSMPAGISIDSQNRINHGGGGNTSVILDIRLSPRERAELAAGRNLKIVLRLEAGAFTATPFIQDTEGGGANAVATLTDGFWVIMVTPALHADNTFLRVRWTAATGSRVLGPMLMFAAQNPVAPSILEAAGIGRRWAREVAEQCGNHKWGYNVSNETLQAAVGTTQWSDEDPVAQIAGGHRLNFNYDTRGLTTYGGFTYAIVRVTGTNNSLTGLSFSGGNRAFGANNGNPTLTGGYAPQTLRFGDIRIVRGVGSTIGSGTIIDRLVSSRVQFDNRGGSQIGVEVLSVMFSDTELDPRKLYDWASVVQAQEAKLARTAVVNKDAQRDPDGDVFTSLAEAVRRGYGAIALTSECNEPGGIALNYPVHIFSRLQNRPVVGGWIERGAGDFTQGAAPNTGTWSINLSATHDFQGGVAGLVTLYRINTDGTTVDYRLVSSIEQVQSGAGAGGTGAPSYFYDTAAKTLHINDNTAGAIYRLTAACQASMIAARSRRPGTILERLDVRLADDTIFATHRGHLEFRDTRFGRTNGNGLQSEAGAIVVDNYPVGSIAEFCGNDGWGSNSFIGNPVRWHLRNSGARFTNGDGFAPHGDWMIMACDLEGCLWAEDIGKMGIVTITPGVYRFNIRCGNTGLRNFGGGAVMLLVGNGSGPRSTVESNYIEGDHVQIESRCDGILRDVVINPKLGGGAGANTVTIPATVRIGRLRVRRQLTLDFPNIANGASSTATQAVTLAQVGDFVRVAANQALAGMQLTAWVSSAGNVSIRAENNTGAPVDLPSASVFVEVERMTGPFGLG